MKNHTKKTSKKLSKKENRNKNRNKKKTNKHSNDELMKYKYLFGLEREAHIFHNPHTLNNNTPYNSKKTNNNFLKNEYLKGKKAILNVEKEKPIKEYVVYNSYSAIERLLKNHDKKKIKLTKDEIIFLEKLLPVYESSGRICNGVEVLKKLPVPMPEFISSYPLSSSLSSFYKYKINIQYINHTLFKILMKDTITQKYVKKYGKLSTFPFGMSSYIKVLDKDLPKNENNNNNDNNTSKKKLWKDYLGSYHISLTLPFLNTTTTEEFIDNHVNLANILQWIEPLLITAFFTSIDKCGYEKNKYSFAYRPTNTGWGNFAGSDVRLFKTGIGRYAKTPTYWRENFKFYQSDNLKHCLKPSPSAIKEKGITSLSSDFRTFGLASNGERLSGAGMTLGNGFEFRIFDNFNPIYLQYLNQLIILMAENSRVKKCDEYVYENKCWIKTIQNIILNGYKAELDTEYIDLLRKHLDLKLNTKSIIAKDIFDVLYKELLNKNNNGLWYRIMYSKFENEKICPNLYDNLIFIKNKKIQKIILPDINKESWQFGFMLKCNSDKKLLTEFNLLSIYLKSMKIVSIELFRKLVLKFFGKKWSENIIDIAYFYDSLNNVKLEKNENGTIKNLIIKKTFIKLHHTFNDFLHMYYQADNQYFSNKFFNNNNNNNF